MRDIKDLIAEVYGVVWTNDTQIKNLERLVELARADERDAIAQMVEGIDGWNMDDPASTAAEAIRKRSNP